jgi:integrase
VHAYATRISQNYSTLRTKIHTLSRFWHFIDERYPAVQSSAEIRPEHAKAYLPYAVEKAARVRRGGPAAKTDASLTVENWLSALRTFFSDICLWAAEPDSPFAELAPRAIPFSFRDLTGLGLHQVRKQMQARMTATILDLEREMPRIRALAFQRWHEALDAVAAMPGDGKRGRAENTAFWDWALLELLVQSGLRIEEAHELTTLDILKRSHSDGKVYYLLHVKPSKYDRARVIPIGDGLGRVLAEIMRHSKRFYGLEYVPACDNWDFQERKPLPRAPYLLQGVTRPNMIGLTTLRQRLANLAVAAGARHADGSPLVLRPHDCRRVFASEHLNHHTPIHVIQALLGHATPNTVMVYAKLYPTTLIESYRQAVRGMYRATHGDASLRNPTLEEWEAFAATCSLRDMGTHLCALPTGEHCPRGLVCLGCVHAQPKKSAAPIFAKMLASHERALQRARESGEPPGQIAARELEVARIRSAWQRAKDLATDVAEAIEAGVAGPGDPGEVPCVVLEDSMSTSP